MANPLPSGLFYQTNMKEISASDLIKRKALGEELILIDVREEWEFDEENLGTKCCPLGELPLFLEELSDFKQQEIIVFCKTGDRSKKAQKFLFKNGFLEVTMLAGGLEAYRAAIA